MEKEKKMKKKLFSKAFMLVALFLIASILCASAIVCAAVYDSDATVLVSDNGKPLRLWYDEEAPYGNEDLSWYYKANNPTGVYYTLNENDGWERWSMPLGNGYFGANVFGRTDSERIQISEKTLASVTKIDGINVGGINNFSETYLDFGHPSSEVTNYSRGLDLRTAISTVEYDYSGVSYTREYFVSYPDKVLVIYLSASGEGNLNFTLRPTVPYEQEYALNEGDGVSKSGTVVADAESSTIILSGNMGYYDVDFEARYKLISDGGTVSASNVTYTAEDGTSEYLDDGRLTVSGANEAYIVVALGTNYVLDPSIFNTSNSTPAEKLDDTVVVSDTVCAELACALEKSYAELKENHVADYSELFSRVELDIGGVVPTVTTDELLNSYPYEDNEGYNRYLEELYFQYGRYLLIASSRENSLPSNLQGVWNRYNVAPFGAGMWHNINEQMNYWPAFTTNLAETFEGYVSYYRAYKEAAEDMATYVLKVNSSDYPNFVYSSEQGVYGWCLGTATTPYTISGSRSPGNLGFMLALFYDWYEFTQNTEALVISYDALEGASRFITTLMQEQPDGTYLNPYSDSPEMFVDGVWYYTEGSTYDQTFAYENAKNTLALAEKLEKMGELKVDGVAVSIDEVPVLVTLKEQIDKYDAILVGYSGQIKEFREESYYCDVGDFPNHRHISQLVGLYPANTINSNTPAWLDAARVSLLNRGNESEGWGWAMAHRMGCWARLKDGENVYELYKKLLSEKTATNLWCLTNSGFQIDGNFGGTAGVAEMLLQSHEGYIEPLAAIPAAWASGQYNGLVARGNFTVSAAWDNNALTTLNIVSGSGGVCRVKCDGIAGATVYAVGETGKTVVESSISGGIIVFATEAGKTYIVSGFDDKENVSAPTAATAIMASADTLDISWNVAAGADSYAIYKAVENEPTYTKIAETTDTSISYNLSDGEKNKRMTFKVVSELDSGAQSDSGAIAYVVPIELTLSDCEAVVFDGSRLQITLFPEENPEGEYDKFSLYEVDNGVSTLVADSSYGVLIYDGYDSTKEYAVTATVGYVETAEYKIDGFVYARSPEAEANNIFLGKLFKETTGAAYYASYPISMVTDGIDNSNTNRYASNASHTKVVFELDLEGTYFLDTLVITAFQNYAETSRSLTDVVLQVYKEGVWSDGYSDYTTEIKLGSYNRFTLQLGALEAEAVRLTLTNTYSGGISIKEITCTDAPYTEAGAQKEVTDVLLGLTPEVIGRADSADHGSYPIKNITDGDTKTRWSSSGAMNNYMNVKFTLDGKYELYDLVVNMFDKKTAVSYVKLHYNGSVSTVYDKNSADNPAELIDITTKNYDYYFSLGGMKADAIEFYFVAGDSVDTSTKQWLSIFDITCTAKTEEKIYGIADKKALVDAIDYVSSFNLDAVDSQEREIIEGMLEDAIGNALNKPSNTVAISIMTEELNSACDHSHGITLGDCKLCGTMMLGVCAATVCLDDNISLYFYYHIDDAYLDDTEAYVSFALNGRVMEVKLTDAIKCDNGTYLFVCPLFVTEMTSAVETKLVLSDGEESEAVEYSVRAYAEHVLNNVDTNEEYARCAPLIKAMLDFGGYSQIYTGRYTDNLANEGLEEIEITADFSEYAPTVSGELPEGIEYYGMSVVLDSYIRVKHYFKVDASAEIPEGFVPCGDYYYVAIDGFTAVEYADMNTYSIGEWEISYCVMSYCYLANANNPTLEMQKLVSSIYNYYEQARLYKDGV